MRAALEPAAAAPPPAAVPATLRRRERKTLAVDAFDLFPNPIMVCDSRGRVVVANARLRDELGVTADGGATCCTLLGCGRPGTELEDGCITARALDHRDTLPEVGVDSPVGRMRVNAAPLYQDRSHVVIELRHERHQGDAQQGLRIYTFGQLR